MIQPGNDAVAKKCILCGEKVDVNHGMCYGCHLAAMLPKWYPHMERYAFTYDNLGLLVRSHRNATRKPRTGNPILDGNPASIRLYLTGQFLRNL